MHGSDVAALWEDAVAEELWRTTDFEVRDSSIQIPRPTPRLVGLVDALAAVHDLDRSEAIDRAIRCLVAAYADEAGLSRDLRESHDVAVLIPPQGWIADHAGQIATVDDGAEERAGQSGVTRLDTTVPTTVHEMVSELIEVVPLITGYSEFATRAVCFLADNLDLELLHADLPDGIGSLPSKRQHDTTPADPSTGETEATSPASALALSTLDYPGETHALVTTTLMGTRARQRMLDLFLTGLEPGEWVGPTEISERADIAPTSVHNHIDVFVRLGILRKHDQRPRYTVAVESAVVGALRDLEAALNEAYDSADG